MLSGPSRNYAASDGIACPSCQSKRVIKREFGDTEPTRQRYRCGNCHTLCSINTIFAGHHQPLKIRSCVSILWASTCRTSKLPTGGINGSDVQQMTAQLREGIVKKKAGGLLI